MIDFEAEVNKYGESLSTDAKDKARAAFNELLAQGRTFEWLYYAIKQLNGRSIQKYPKLLFYRGFQEEVDALLLKGKEILNDSYYDFPYRHWHTNIVSILNRSEEEFMARYNRDKKDLEVEYIKRRLEKSTQTYYNNMKENLRHLSKQDEFKLLKYLK